MGGGSLIGISLIDGIVNRGTTALNGIKTFVLFLQRIFVCSSAGKEKSISLKTCISILLKNSTLAVHRLEPVND
jgi:hypothetical protein